MRNSTSRRRTSHRAVLFPLAIAVATVAAWLLAGSSDRDNPGENKSGGSTMAAPFAKDASAQGATTVPEIAPPDKDALGSAFTLLSPLPRPVITAKVPEDPSEPVPPADLMVNKSVPIDPASLAALQHLPEGAPVSFPLPGGGFLNGSVRLRQQSDGGITLAGSLNAGTGSQFTLAYRAEETSGLILDPVRKLAYEITAHPDDGRPLLQEKPLGAVVCAGIPRDPNSPEPERFSMPGGPMAAITVPALDSLPGATEVLYLDFDGEVVTDPLWAGGQTIIAEPARIGNNLINPNQITDVWRMVAEDFLPFRVSVTTSLARYNSAAIGRRMRCIVTPTTDAGPGTGGVAYVNSFSRAGTGNFSADIPCWAFVGSNTSSMALVISHELGHTVGLIHHGLAEFDDGERVLPGQEYYGGHGTGATSWGPIMGAPYGRRLTQWSKGEYFRANRGPSAQPAQRQDDLTLIGRLENHFGLRPDSVGNNIGAAKRVSGNLLGNIDESGIILTQNDLDFFEFISDAGPLTVTGTPAPLDHNLKVRLQLLNNAGEIIVTANPPNGTSATINRDLVAGTYYLVVSSGETGNPLAEPPNPPTGFTTYGSIGAYTLSGTFTSLPALPLIVSEPESVTVDEGRPFSVTVQALSNSTVRYQWFRTPPGGVEAAVSGATGATFRVGKAAANHIGSYRVRLTNNTGFVFSEMVEVGVRLRPRILTQPLDVTIDAGDPALFAPPHVGEPPLTYRWMKNNATIPGEEGPELSIPAVEWASGGVYRLEITNALGRALTRAFRLTVRSAPIFIHVPALFAVPIGGNATLAPQVVGSPALRYQWFKDGEEIPRATRPSLRLAGRPEAIGNYQLRVTNNEGTLTSNDIAVVIDERLRITEHPVGASITRGDRVVLNVETSGDDPRTYQWQRNRVNIPGATNQTLEIDPANWFDNGRYRVIVENRVSRVTSRQAVVRVSSRPEITLQPPPLQKGARTRSTTLAARAEGTPRLRYQWFKDGEPVPGATRNRLTLRRLDVEHEGNYTLQASNELGDIESDPVTLVVEDAPAIALQPQPGFFAIGDNMTATVGATGTETLNYQWQRNNRDIPGQNTADLTFPGTALNQSGRFRVIITNDVGRVVSRQAALTVQIPPEITVQPSPSTIFEGERAQFTVTATGTRTLRYRWLKDGVQMGTARNLVLNDARMDKAGEYVVEVRNNVGMVESIPVNLQILDVPVPSVSQLIPLTAQPGHRFALRGSQLRFARRVTVRNVAVPFTKTTAGEIIGTIPTTLTSGGAVKVESLGGTANSPSNLTIQARAENDDFENSRVIVGSNLTSQTDNFQYTSQTGEPSFTRTHSAWWRWIAPRTGRFIINTDGIGYDSVLGVYRGENLASLITLALNDDVAPFIRWSEVTVDVVEGAAYRIAVGLWPGVTGAGPTVLNIRPASASAPLESSLALAVDSPPQELEDAGPVLAELGPVEDGAMTLGGGADAGSITYWRPAFPEDLADAEVIHTSAQLTLDPSRAADGSVQSFGWTFYDSNEEPLLAIQIHGTDGTLRAFDAAGRATDLNAALQANAPALLELSIDQVSGSWSASLDGQPLAENLPLHLPAGAKPRVADMSIEWLQPDTSHPSLLHCSELRVSSQAAN
jgi:hypothetical protein